MVNKFKNLSFPVKITLLMTPVLILASGLLCISSTVLFYNEVINTNLRTVDSFAGESAENIDFFIQDIVQTCVVLSQNETLIEIVENADTATHPIYVERELEELFSVITLPSNDSNVYVISDEELLFSYLYDIDRSVDFYSMGWFPKQPEDHYFISDPHPALYNYSYKNDEHISVVTPIGNRSHPVGYIIYDLSVDRIEDMLPSLNGLDYTGIYIKDNVGTEILTLGSSLNNGPATYVEVEHPIHTADWVLTLAVSEEYLQGPINDIVSMTVIITILSIAFFVIIVLFASRSFYRPIRRLVTRMEEVSNNNFTSNYDDIGSGEIGYIRQEFEHMVDSVDQLVEDVYRYDLHKKQMEYDMLVSKINPHFLYNSLQLILSDALESENMVIVETVENISDLLKYNLSEHDSEKTVGEEIQNSKSYLNILKQRFSELFEYEIISEEGVEDCKILKFTLQPIVENCFKHAFKDMDNGGLIRITVYKSDNTLKVSVLDNGCGFDEEFLQDFRKKNTEKHSGHIGLRNTDSRIKIKYGKQYGLEIKSQQNMGSEVICILPFDNKSYN